MHLQSCLHLSQLKLRPHGALTPPHPTPQPLVSTTLLPVSLNLTALGTSCKWNPVVSSSVLYHVSVSCLFKTNTLSYHILFIRTYIGGHWGASPLALVRNAVHRGVQIIPLWDPLWAVFIQPGVPFMCSSPRKIWQAPSQSHRVLELERPSKKTNLTLFISSKYQRQD